MRFASSVTVGERVMVYRNLHNGLLSVVRRTDHGPRVDSDAYCQSALLTSVEFRVRQAGWQRVQRENVKNVHAFIVGQWNGNDLPAWLPDARRIRYSPTEHPYFYDVDSDTRTDVASAVFVTVAAEFAGPPSWIPYLPGEQ